MLLMTDPELLVPAPELEPFTFRSYCNCNSLALQSHHLCNVLLFPCWMSTTILWLQRVFPVKTQREAVGLAYARRIALPETTKRSICVGRFGLKVLSRLLRNVCLGWGSSLQAKLRCFASRTLIFSAGFIPACCSGFWNVSISVSRMVRMDVSIFQNA